MNFKLPSFIVNWGQKPVNLENPFPSLILIQKLLTYFFLRVSAYIFFSSYPCFSFFLDVCLGCHQLSTAETHT